MEYNFKNVYRIKPKDIYLAIFLIINAQKTS